MRLHLNVSNDSECFTVIESNLEEMRLLKEELEIAMINAPGFQHREDLKILELYNLLKKFAW